MLECRNHSYYTGYTNDIRRRYQEHQQGSPKCKYTRAHPPIALRACWVGENKSEALKAEAFIKKLTRKAKQVLLTKPQQLSQHFPGLAFYSPFLNDVCGQ